MSGVQHNAYTVAARLEARGPAMARELGDELDRQAKKVASTMRREAPDFQAVMRNSILPVKTGAYEWTVAPGTDYAQAVHDGVKPGKGLPKWAGPNAGDVTRWLELHPRVPTKSLRDRYFGLSKFIHDHGTKANPFVERAFVEHASSVVAALKAAALRGLQLDGAGSGGSAVA